MDESKLIEQLKAVSFPTLGHFLEEGFADSQLRAMVPNVKVVGRALTLKLVGADAIAVNQALALIKPGDVLVIDTGGDHRHAPVGAVTSCAARCAGVVGIVVDGAVTDLLELREAGLPVFARGTSLLTTKLHGRGDSQINQPIHCAGVTVNPGDLVLADDNGVLFLDWLTAATVIDQALASDHAEPRLLERLKSGEPVAQVLKT
ncbi:RraA family protein [Pseudomonas frederiksbergensis]|uniref:Putative 4-hydroxy-4-methyl-2-oxoglutarate aldolase n=1 Tax=Pseudomonas frederiksbergensis TaxID=104087 RepID=A0A423K606_9PSED|nr:RraA family protein [Pseudomonas frederiksbergensis]RON47106.1 dimethylmenaquinone methyltransferase [Pseudomonas frederiksbergensis]